MPQYLLSVHLIAGGPEPSDEEKEQMHDAVVAFHTRLQAEGAFVFAGGLYPEATVVDSTGGERVTTSGRFAEREEQLGGFWVVETSDMDAALELAALGSAARKAPVEVRKFHDPA